VNGPLRVDPAIAFPCPQQVFDLQRYVQASSGRGPDVRQNRESILPARVIHAISVGFTLPNSRLEVAQIDSRVDRHSARDCLA
jgi:hypothetical protein